jgi:predicted dehydrogenase
MGGHESLGAVVVGTGFGCFTHVRALRAAGFDVLGVVGRDPAKTAERARRFEVPRGRSLRRQTRWSCPASTR